MNTKSLFPSRLRGSQLQSRCSEGASLDKVLLYQKGCSLCQTSFGLCSAVNVAMGGGKAVALPQDSDGQVRAGMHVWQACDAQPAAFASERFIGALQRPNGSPNPPTPPRWQKALYHRTPDQERAPRRCRASRPCCAPSRASISARQGRMPPRSSSPELRSSSRSAGSAAMSR